MKAIFVRTRDGLLASSAEAMRICAQYQPGEEVLIEHKRGRSAGNHKRFFAFVNLTFDWQDTYEDKTIWRKVLEMGAGHFDTIIDMRGNVHMWPKSIAWDELDDEQEFRDLFGAVVNAYLSRYGQQLSEAQINMVVQF